MHVISSCENKIINLRYLEHYVVQSRISINISCSFIIIIIYPFGCSGEPMIS